MFGFDLDMDEVRVWREGGWRDQERTYRVRDPDKPQLDILIVFYRIPIKLSLPDSASIIFRTAQEHSTLWWFECRIPLTAPLRQGPCGGPNFGVGR